MYFSRYTVIPAARVLLSDGEPVKLGARAFDLLVVLLSARGLIVSKSTVMDHVWPGLHVSEGSLRFQVTVLRRALGDAGDAIKSVSGRGYLLADAGDPVGRLARKASM